MVMLAFQNLGKTPNGVCNIDKTALNAGELFSNEERLRQESLDLSGSVND